MNEQVQRLLAGDRRALARLLTQVENGRANDALTDLFPHTGGAWVVGITGAPGTGKSTLVSQIIRQYRARGETTAVLAVDPTSPFSGGAILGDRIRMQDHVGDQGVFIRSMATRGSLGGLARAAHDAIRVLDAAGFDIILVETVGAGQNEVQIVRTANTTIVVEAPGMGDEVQAIKAGILEIADVLVVNKADRPGVHHTVQALRLMIDLGHPVARQQTAVRHHGRLTANENAAPAAPIDVWIPPIIQTVASEGKGINEVIAAIDAHRAQIETNAQRANIERQYIEFELHERLRESVMARLLEDIPGEALDALVERILAREVDPQRAVTDILAQMQMEWVRQS